MAEPYCLAMVLCDAVHRDPATGKFTLLGTFSNFSAKSFPTKVRFSIYFAITDGMGLTTLRIQACEASVGYVDARNENEEPGRVFLAQTQIDLGNPLAVFEQGIGFETIIPTPGLYHCELWAGNEVLMTRRFTATEIKEQG